MDQKSRLKIRDFTWIVIVCAAQFVLTGAIWIRRTYGVLFAAMTNIYFLNFLQNKRRLFLLYVILPTICTFLALMILQTIIARKKSPFTPPLILFYLSLTLLLLSFLGAFFCMDAGPYVTRRYRLAKEQWYDTDRIVVHALGKIDGVTYTNSKEALENSCQSGVRFLECDFSMTADHQLASCHDWDFWFGWEHDTTDTDPKTLAEPFKAMVALAEKNDCREVLDRFIVQIYCMYMYDMVQDVYHFPNYIYTLYQEGFGGETERMEEFAEFCMLHDIDVITMGAKVYSEELYEIASRYNLQIFVHTVNSEEEIKSYIEKGIGVYTDKTEFDFL